MYLEKSEINFFEKKSTVNELKIKALFHLIIFFAISFSLSALGMTTHEIVLRIKLGGGDDGEKQGPESTEE